MNVVELTENENGDAKWISDLSRRGSYLKGTFMVENYTKEDRNCSQCEVAKE